LLYPCIDVSISLLFERQTGDPIGGLTADQSVREGYKRQFKNKLAAVFGQFFQAMSGRRNPENQYKRCE